MSKININEAKIGRYGRMLLAHMQEYNQDLYTELLFTGRIGDWLIENRTICKERVFEYTQQIAMSNGVNEGLKAHDQLAWVGAMNAIKAQAEEIVIAELISK